MSMIKLSSDSISKRDFWVFKIAKWISIKGYHHLTDVDVEIPEEFFELKKQNSVFFYAALHKSFWETTGVMVALYLSGLPIPYAGMGDNLVKGRFFQSLAEKTGVFLIKRATSRSEMPESARLLKEVMVNYFAHGKDIIVFPEGTRKSILSKGQYGKFFPTVFEATLEYERTKDEIKAQYPDLNTYNAYIIPTNVDYSIIREDYEMLDEYKGKPRTLHVLDSLKMLKHIHETYVTFGKPIKVADIMHMDRKGLAVLAREKCLELVKILPINVLAKAIVESVEEGKINIGKIEENIVVTVQKLIRYKDRFRGFTPEDKPRDIYEKVIRYKKDFKYEKLDINKLELFKFYANFIGHYFEQEKKSEGNTEE